MIVPDLNIPENAVLHILILDFETLACEETSASGFDQKGCRVHTSANMQLGKVIGVRLAGYDQMIKGRVSELTENEAQITFEFSDAPDYEKRSERRRKVSIPVWVSGRTSDGGLRCRIVDASQSGCRLLSKYLEELPADIKLQIPGLDLPVYGEIVWRSADFAGVRLLWKFSNGAEFDTKVRRKRSTKPTAKEAGSEQSNATGFGVKRKKRKS